MRCMSKWCLQKQLSRQDNLAKSMGVQKLETRTIVSTLPTILKLSNSPLLQGTRNGLSHRAREFARNTIIKLVDRLRDVSFMAALLSNFHVLRIHDMNATIHDLDFNFFYFCLVCVTGKGKAHSWEKVQELERSEIISDKKKLKKWKMENSVLISYQQFMQLELSDVNNQANRQRNPAHPAVYEREGLTYFMPSIANDMVQNIANLVSSNFIQVQQREIMVKMKKDKPSLSIDHAKKLSLHLFKLIHSPHGTFWPTTVPQSQEMIDYMTTEYGL